MPRRISLAAQVPPVRKVIVPRGVFTMLPEVLSGFTWSRSAVRDIDQACCKKVEPRTNLASYFASRQSMRALIDAISLRNASLPCTIHRTICVQFVCAILIPNDYSHNYFYTKLQTQHQAARVRSRSETEFRFTRVSLDFKKRNRQRRSSSWLNRLAIEVKPTHLNFLSKYWQRSGH